MSPTCDTASINWTSTDHIVWEMGSYTSQYKSTNANHNDVYFWTELSFVL